MIKLNDRKTFLCRPRPQPLTKIYVTQMLTCDLFAVANPLVK